jgi:hypothetical protein
LAQEAAAVAMVEAEDLLHLYQVSSTERVILAFAASVSIRVEIH